MENRIKYTGIFLILIVLGVIISCSESSDTLDVTDVTDVTNNTSGSNCPTKTCDDFSTQPEAQSTYNSNKSCYKNLDGDGNGKACEHLPKK